MLRWFVRFWRVDDGPQVADVVAAVSYGLRPDRTLTSGTEAINKLAIRAFNWSRARTLVYGVNTHTVDPVVEMRLRAEDFESIPRDFTLCVGRVESTIEEAEHIATGLRAVSRFPRSLIVVTGACHSRTARWVWKKVFPKTRVFVRSIPIDEELDSNSPMVFLRNGWTWLGINVARHVVFRIIGYRVARLLPLHQPNALR